MGCPPAFPGPGDAVTEFAEQRLLETTAANRFPAAAERLDRVLIMIEQSVVRNHPVAGAASTVRSVEAAHHGESLQGFVAAQPLGL